MIERFRLWLRRWIGCIKDAQAANENFAANKQIVEILQKQVQELRAEVTRLQIERYVPPQPEEPKRKVIPTNTFKQFNDIVEREEMEREASDAVR